MTNGNDPVYPCMIAEADASCNGGGIIKKMLPGVTKREFFGAMALQGILANIDLLKSCDETETSPEELAVIITDSLIKALNKKQ